MPPNFMWNGKGINNLILKNIIGGNIQPNVMHSHGTNQDNCRWREKTQINETEIEQ